MEPVSRGSDYISWDLLHVTLVFLLLHTILQQLVSSSKYNEQIKELVPHPACMRTNFRFSFAACMLVAHEIVSNSENNLERTTVNEQLVENDKQVLELLDDKDLCDLLIQRLEIGGHVVKKAITTNGNATFSSPWPPPPG